MKSVDLEMENQADVLDIDWTPVTTGGEERLGRWTRSGLGQGVGPKYRRV